MKYSFASDVVIFLLCSTVLVWALVMMKMIYWYRSVALLFDEWVFIVYFIIIPFILYFITCLYCPRNCDYRLDIDDSEYSRSTYWKVLVPTYCIGPIGKLLLIVLQPRSDNLSIQSARKRYRYASCTLVRILSAASVIPV